MAAFGVRACAKTNSTRLPNCSIAVLLDVDAGAGLARIDSAPDRLESEPEEFHATVVEAFRALAGGDPDRYLVIAAHGDRDEISAQILARVTALIADRSTT